MLEKKSLVIIPTFNESDNIKQIIDEIFRLEDNFSILVVDDNSPDKTASLVKEKSLLRNTDSLEIYFEITDLKNTIAVTYNGLLPDLFKENKGVVATGYFFAGKNEFQAYEILAKHDENYVPKEVEKALE